MVDDVETLVGCVGRWLGHLRRRTSRSLEVGCDTKTEFTPARANGAALAANDRQANCLGAGPAECLTPFGFSALGRSDSGLRMRGINAWSRIDRIRGVRRGVSVGGWTPRLFVE